VNEKEYLQLGGLKDERLVVSSHTNFSVLVFFFFGLAVAGTVEGWLSAKKRLERELKFTRLSCVLDPSVWVEHP